MPKEKKTQNLLKKAGDRGLASNKEYNSALTELKKQIRESQVKAMVAVNKELILLYWNIGKTIVEKQEKSDWGPKS